MILDVDVMSFLPAVNEVWGNVIFSQACVILLSGRGVPERAPLDRDPPWRETLGQRSPWIETPPPQTETSPWTEIPRMIKSGRYTSYWNTF